MSAVDIISEFVLPDLAKICNGYFEDDPNHKKIVDAINKLEHIKISLDKLASKDDPQIFARPFTFAYGGLDEYKIKFCNNCDKPFMDANFYDYGDNFCGYCQDENLCTDCCELQEVKDDPGNKQCCNCGIESHPNECVECGKNIVGRRLMFAFCSDECRDRYRCGIFEEDSHLDEDD